jgi:hypothetical protein
MKSNDEPGRRRRSTRTVAVYVQNLVLVVL